MKKLIFIPVLAMFIFVSCKKSSSSPSAGTGSISATIDGKQETFNTEAWALDLSSAGVYTISIAGHQGVVGASDELSLVIGGANPVTIGSYNSGMGNPDDFSIVYSESGKIIYGDGIGAPQNEATVTITSITGTNVQGTFSSILTFLSGPYSTTTKAVTNGKFNVNFK